MCPTSMIAILLTSACLSALRLRPPPPPTFDKHVDYIAWSNDFVGTGKKEGACEPYSAASKVTPSRSGENPRAGATSSGPARETESVRAGGRQRFEESSCSQLTR